MKIEFKHLTEVPRSDIIDLMNNPLVQRYMPLTGETFSERDYNEFIAAKEQLWTEYGYGPWAFLVDGQFVGWGGLQPEDGDADLGLVLHPNHWGLGQVLYLEIIERGFGEMGFESITALLPPIRKRTKGLLRLGFKPDGELMIEGERFIRFRLSKNEN
jgi:ribosomal-protein-alanine N-acetyltransferase